MTEASTPADAVALPLNPLARLWRSLSSPFTAQWRRRTLATQFMMVSSLAVIIAMFALGKWITRQIETSVIHSAAASTALFSDSLIEPYVQELKSKSELSPENQKMLNRLLAPQLAGKSIIAFKIWQGDTIIYSNRTELIGRSFPSTEARARAWTGQVVPAFGKLSGSDDIAEAKLPLPILEFFAPVRETGTNRIIALAETYEVAAVLRDDLADALKESWLTVGGVTLAMIGLQLGIVMRGSRTIDSQRQALSDRIDALTHALADNKILRARSHDANRRVTEINERFLRQLGADLHDGPVQLLSLTQLRLGCLRDIVRRVSANGDAQLARDAEEDFRVIEEAVSDSLDEIRGVSVGLVPPEIEQLELSDALRMAARRHQRRTGKEVACDIGKLPDSVPLALKGCFYRFAQEGLNNAFRHAKGVGQVVTAKVSDGSIEVCVLDRGPGIVAGQAYDGIGGQGLLLLRDRVESLGGTFAIESRKTGGVRLKAVFDVTEEQLIAA
jgi:signal transduction histidine kinase